MKKRQLEDDSGGGQGMAKRGLPPPGSGGAKSGVPRPAKRPRTVSSDVVLPALVSRA